MIVRLVAAAALVIVIGLGACGRKGDPLPPQPADETQEQTTTG